MNEKQFNQANENLNLLQQKPATSALSSETIKAVFGNVSPLCHCGKPRQKVFFKLIDKYVHSTWCDECEKTEAAKAIADEQLEARNVIVRAIKREIEPIYHKATMNDFNQDVRDMLAVKPPEKGSFIWGKTGTGKSHLASALIKQALVAGKRAKMVKFKDMVLQIRASYDDNRTEESILRPYIQCYLLSIEDIGTIRSGKVESDFCQDTLLTVIDARLERKLPTVITTNLSPETIYASFGERLASRFGTFLTFKLEGEDRRLSL
jgi:DNA replication protein DnaC